MEIKNDYDYLNAILSGITSDSQGHWASRVSSGKQEGLILKALNHPTIMKTLLEEIEKGYIYWYKDPEEKKMYTYNKIVDLFDRWNKDTFLERNKKER